MELDTKISLVYCIILFSSVYGFELALMLTHMRLSFPMILLINFTYLLAFTGVAIFLSRILKREVNEMFGLRREGILESLMLAGAIYFIVVCLPAIIFILMSGANAKELITKWVESAEKPRWFYEFPRELVPLIALLVWSISGIGIFVFLQAFLYECLRFKPKKYVLPLVMATTCLIYNAPLVSGAWKPDDILVLGVLYPLVYHKTRNSVGLILTYVLIFEAPVLWAFWFGWGWTVFWYFIYCRFIWSLCCLLVLLSRYIGIAGFHSRIHK